MESITVLHLLVLPFPNSNSCQAFSEFITETILDRVANGSLSAWWRVGEVPPFHLVMPIAVEPSKPRVCHDERFLNLWIKDLPFSLGLITDLPRNVHKGGFQSISVFRQIVAPGWPSVECLVLCFQYPPLWLESQYLPVSLYRCNRVQLYLLPMVFPVPNI